jgi:hypothetical protein
LSVSALAPEVAPEEARDPAFRGDLTPSDGVAPIDGVLAGDIRVDIFICKSISGVWEVKGGNHESDYEHKIRTCFTNSSQVFLPMR